MGRSFIKKMIDILSVKRFILSIMVSLVFVFFIIDMMNIFVVNVLKLYMVFLILYVVGFVFNFWVR